MNLPALEAFAHCLLVIAIASNVCASICRAKGSLSKLVISVDPHAGGREICPCGRRV